VKTVLAFVVLTATAHVLTGCCCPCGSLPIPEAGTSVVSPQARAVAEHIVAQATPGELKF
jgi:hypothetical protein